ncbi:hypothetical protein Poly30_46900 [Planctomycetes bacterium Poly30]|uniref:KAP family P-loop domain protein n=1 Tax=Saltatorellus ferox TaxID=2528018 RepID=A0A518EYH5_9BACT|nr:hypothetical protein Poly30_46900 [Planctomycetes bacterium Poly30]
MFPHTWRHHWALDEDPFVQEDADKDTVLARVPMEAVHSSFDRLYGSTDSPGPGIVFGEKGSGKSSLRLAMKRRLENDADARALYVEYIEFDSFLTEARKADRLPPNGQKTPRRVVERYLLADHIDAMLSLGVSKLADEIADGKHPSASSMSPKHKASLVALTGLYYRSDERSGDEIDRGLRRVLKQPSGRSFLTKLVIFLAAVAGVAVGGAAIADSFNVELPFEVQESGQWRVLGGILLSAAGLLAWIPGLVAQRRASKATKAVRVVPRDPDPLAALLLRIPSSVRRDLALPEGPAVGTRLVLLQRFIAILHDVGYRSFWVLMDRIDEATVLSGRADLMRPFVESLLEHRLLQFEGMALKLFLPIELSRLYLGASPDALKSMRLDKASSIPELRWTGQELSQVAAQRLRAVRPDGTPLEEPGARLMDFFAEEIDENQVRETLSELGTPRLAFGFLGALMAEHARELSDDLPQDDPAWRIPQRRFEILRASWLDRARGLRRALN